MFISKKKNDLKMADITLLESFYIYVSKYISKFLIGLSLTPATCAVLPASHPQRPRSPRWSQLPACTRTLAPVRPTFQRAMKIAPSALNVAPPPSMHFEINHNPPKNGHECELDIWFRLASRATLDGLGVFPIGYIQRNSLSVSCADLNFEGSSSLNCQ